MDTVEMKSLTVGDTTFEIVDEKARNVFVADYATATFAEIKAAHDAGKICFVKYNNLICPSISIADSGATFVGSVSLNIATRITFSSDGTKKAEQLSDVGKWVACSEEQNLPDSYKANARKNINAQEKLVGVQGQVVGFDANGNPVAQAAPQGGGGDGSDGFFTLYVDENGDLWAYCEDTGEIDFEYDAATGNLYVVQETGE